MTALCESGLSGLADLPSLTLEELNASASLLTRVDRKYVLTRDQADGFLAALPAGTRVLDIDSGRSFGYASTYFDTAHLDSFHDAAHRRARRGKTRTRTYLDSGITFLEVKTKRRAATVKSRLPWSGTEADAAASAFVAEKLAEGGVRPSGRLSPVLDVTYRRTTLLLPDAEGRVTLDVDLDWRLRRGADRLRVDDLVIVETKSSSHPCAADRLLWRTGHRPTSISKYATALAALRPDLARNRWHRLLSTGPLAA